MIQMKFNGRERTLPLPLTPGMIKHLGLEAAVRNLRMGELIRELLISTIGRISRAATTDAFDGGDHGARQSELEASLNIRLPSGHSAVPWASHGERTLGSANRR